MKPSWPLDARGRERGRGKYIHLVINKRRQGSVERKISNLRWLVGLHQFHGVVPIYSGGVQDAQDATIHSNNCV